MITKCDHLCLGLYQILLLLLLLFLHLFRIFDSENVLSWFGILVVEGGPASFPPHRLLFHLNLFLIFPLSFVILTSETGDGGKMRI